MFSVYHDQKDGSEFSDVTLASEDDNDNSDLNECDQEVEKTPIEDYGQDVIFNRSLVNFLITFNLIRVIITLAKKTHLDIFTVISVLRNLFSILNSRNT